MLTGRVVVLFCLVFGLRSPALGLAGHWVKPGLSAEIKAFGESSYQLIFHVVGVLQRSNLLDLDLSHWRFKINFWLEHQYSASHKAQKRTGKKENKQNPKQMVKAKLNRKKHKETDSIRLRQEAKKKEREKTKKQSNQINEESHKWKQTLKTKLENHKIKRNSNAESKLKEAKKAWSKDTDMIKRKNNEQK